MQADVCTGIAYLPLHQVPREGKPQYLWVRMIPLQETTGLLRTTHRAANVVKLHIRVQWLPLEGQAACFACNMSLPGVGISIVDPVTSKIVRELAFLNVSGIEVRTLA
jgi:hypothetical protein